MRLLTGRHRAEHEALIRRCVSAESHLIALQGEVDYFKEALQAWMARCESERARAERAVDELLSVRGFAPITPTIMPSTMPDLLTEDPSEVAEIESRLKAGDASVFAERR